MTRSPCAKFGRGSIISAPCLQRPFLVSGFHGTHRIGWRRPSLVLDATNATDRPSRHHGEIQPSQRRCRMAFPVEYAVKAETKKGDVITLRRGFPSPSGLKE